MLPNHHFNKATALALALGAIIPATAIARPVDDPAIAANRAPATVRSRPDKAQIPVATPRGVDIGNATAPQPVVRIQTPPSGFDWGDAGIGAAGGLALSMIGLGGALGISQYRTRHTRNPTARTS